MKGVDPFPSGLDQLRWDSIQDVQELPVIWRKRDHKHHAKLLVRE